MTWEVIKKVDHVLMDEGKTLDKAFECPEFLFVWKLFMEEKITYLNKRAVVGKDGLHY